MGKGSASCSRWRLRDLVDLEAALEADATVSRDDIEARDRAWMLERAAGIRAIPDSRSGRIFEWLEKVRSGWPDGGPGAVVERALGILRRIAVGFGLVLGAGTAVSVLRYQGDAPVNVTGFFFVLILLQILLTVVSVWGLFRFGQGLPVGWFGESVRSLWTWIAGRLRRFRGAEAGAEMSSVPVGAALEAFFRGHPDLGRYRVARIGQVFGVAFNLGAVIAMFLVLLVADRAFGWQSTLIQSPETFHRIVAVIATPWSGWLPGAAPDPAAVEGSRIILKDGAAALQTPDLVAWWPFLFVAVLVYGLLPRVVLWSVFAGLEWRESGRRRFAGLRYEDLDDRLVAGLRDGSADAGSGVRNWLDAETGAGPGVVPDPASTPQPASDRDGYLLLDDGAIPGFDREDLVQAVENACGAPVSDLVTADSLKNRPPQQRPVALLVESWTAPVEEDLTRIGDLRTLLGPGVVLRVLLLPVPGEVAPEGRWVETWSRFLARLRDPDLAVRALVMETEVAR